MTAIETAFRDAVEKGGWMPHGKKPYLHQGRYEVLIDTSASSAGAWLVSYEMAALDPSFWQALGKARGWDYIDPNDCGGCDTCFQHFGTGPHKNEWKDNWHRFIDHLAEGADAESFFASLSSNGGND